MTTVNRITYYVVYYDDRNNRHTTRDYLKESEANEMMNNLVHKQGYKNAQVVKVQTFYEIKERRYE